MNNKGGNVKIQKQSEANAQQKQQVSQTNEQEALLNNPSKHMSSVGSYLSSASKTSDKGIKKNMRKISMDTSNNLLIDVFNKIANGRKCIPVLEMRQYLKFRGFLNDDPRWKEVYDCLDNIEELNLINFAKIFPGHISHLTKCINNGFVLEDFDSFTKLLEDIFKNQIPNKNGQNAQYIPQLARQDPEKWGMSFCSIDGQRFNIGDYNDDFCIQSCSKPINYGIAVEGVGLDVFHQFVGREPSGRAFNSVALNADNLPYNPMVNSGAIMTCSLVEKELNIAEKFEAVLNWWKRLAGSYKPGFDNSTYLSEYETADNNFHLAYYMQSEGLFPEGTDLELNLQFYFQCCSIEMSCKKLAVVAATLANGGVCPVTHERVFQGSTTKNILSLMYSCGMYDYSGQFAFKVGLPAKSGVSGCVMVVIPSVGGFCTWSPRLDKYGNSARGITFFEELVRRFTFHNFDIVTKINAEQQVIYVCDSSEEEKIQRIRTMEKADEKKTDPLKINRISFDEVISSLLFAAFENDTETIRNLILKNIDLNIKDYDKRTAMHIAASEGHLESVQLLFQAGASATIKDRFGNTSIDDAIRCKHEHIVEFFKKNVK